MREIKLRAWHKKDGVMLPVDAIDFGEKWVSHEAVSVAGRHAPDFDRLSWLDEVELMQYTGLKDKDGVEMYEGDIVSWLGYGEDTDWMEETEQGRDVVTMDRFPYYWLKNEEHEWGEGLIYPENVTVIGNVHETPELLEKGATSGATY